MTTATALATATSHLQESLFSWLEPEPLPAAEEPPPAVEETTAPPTEEAPPPPKDLSHKWIVAAEMEVTPRIASIADFRGSFKTTEGQRVDALEVYCKDCRRPYDEVKGDDCEARIDNRHLIGGDQSVRAKRKVPTPPPSAKLIPGGRISRQGVAAYVAGVSRPR
ncbi:hypothetical protein ACIP9H_33780 [Streptomyces sp. NPDC088732]|uniref:hypothetical protein n=1 Tax=Streptomyces sp. NPDC088732 TaxID=3365879 RepID=UPI003802E800